MKMSSTIFLAVLVTTCVCFQTVMYDLRTIGPFTYNKQYQVPHYQQNAGLSFSSRWQVLGPFQSGTREAVWGADPLERQGGFRNLTYDPETTVTSTLAANGSVKWRLVRADASSSSPSQAKAVLKVSFPEIDWSLLQSVYGWPALQYQAWARGFLEVKGQNNQTIAFFANGLLEFWVDSKHYFGGDYYRYRRAPVILQLPPGRHVVDLRLVRDSRVLGDVGEPIIDVVVEAEARSEPLYLDKRSLLISEATRGQLGSAVASINVQNNMAGWVEIVSIRSPDASQHGLAMEKALHISPYQTRPLIFNVSLGKPSTSRFSVEILYKATNADGGLFKTCSFHINITERLPSEAQKITFLHPAKVVSYAILRPPPLNSACTTSDGQNSLPIILCLHGAGLEADSMQVREMLDAAYGTCAWILFPSGVTPWSGDDWHIWGAADVKAAIAAISCWIENVGWNGPKVSLRDWIVTGHSNGGQGTWFLSTHYPDNIIAAAPVSGYSSIENYIPYSMWQSSEPLISSTLLKSRSSFKHELLLGNLAGIRILQQHGSNDDNVAAYHSRLMHELLEQTGWSSAYYELPGSGHWFEGVMTTPPLLDFYKESTILPHPPEMPLKFTMTIPSSGYMGSKCGIFVDQLQSPDMNGHVTVTRNLENGYWYLQTENIYRFHLSVNASRIGLPAALILDGMKEPFEIDAAMCEVTWYLKDASGRWSVSNEVRWRGIDQRYGRQLGAMDAILSSDGTFAIDMCSVGVEHIALQISRNLFQYFAADSQLIRECDSINLTSSIINGESQASFANFITIAVGDDLPPSTHTGFPIRNDKGRLVLFQRPIYNPFNFTIAATLPLNQESYQYEYEYESGLGALFLRPLQGERLELVVWGADIAGLEQAARLVPTLTGVGQSDFLVLSSSCRWKGHAGLYAAGYFDKAWRISSGSYLSGDARLSGI